MDQPLGVDLSFQRYVAAKKRASTTEDESGLAPYAFSGDRRYLGYMKRVKPVVLAVEATVRMWKTVQKNDLLGTAVRVSPSQFPDVDKLVRRCAQRLNVAPPTVYISQALGSINAHTYGTNDDAFIMINSATVDHLDEKELLFVIGHEVGHIHNGHVVFLTATHYLTQMAGFFVRWIVTPATLALNTWSRRAEVTSDRAGLICCGDLDVAVRTMVKFALGSKKLYEQINLEEYVAQLAEVKEGIGRMNELLHDHPYIPKRVAALRAFAVSEYYRATVLGVQGGAPMNEVDAKVADILSVT